MDFHNMSYDKLNEAYEAMEKMRKLNVEVQCSERGIPVDEHTHERCTACVLETPPIVPPEQKRFPILSKLAYDVARDSKKNGYFPRVRKLYSESQKSPPCLICSSPACRKHSSANFRKDSITVCHSCEELLSLDFVIDVLTCPTPEERRAKMDRVMETYDRTLLLLHYSSQFMETVADSLEKTTERQNKVGVGSSATGLVSGALGIAAAATILSPAGPPLLVASLLFGGSATAVQTGTEAINYFSEPNKLANRILALQGVLVEILNVVGVLRDALMRDHIRSDHYTEADSALTIWTAWPKERVITGSLSSVGRCGLAGAEIAQGASVAGRGSARVASRTGSSLMRTARFARFAGGALSAAVLVLEARSLHATVSDIQSGNPCQKADKIREIHAGMDALPNTAELDSECDRYLQAMAMRIRTMTSQEVADILVEQGEAVLQQAQEQNTTKESEESKKSDDEAPGTSILEGEEETESVTSGSVAASSSQAKSEVLSMSLLERIELHKQLQSTDDSENVVIGVGLPLPTDVDHENEVLEPTASPPTATSNEVEPVTDASTSQDGATTNAKTSQVQDTGGEPLFDANTGAEIFECYELVSPEGTTSEVVTTSGENSPPIASNPDSLF